MVNEHIEDRVDRVLSNGCLILAIQRVGHVDRVVRAVRPIQEALEEGHRERVMGLLWANGHKSVPAVVIAELDAFQVSVRPPNSLGHNVQRQADRRADVTRYNFLEVFAVHVHAADVGGKFPIGEEHEARLGVQGDRRGLLQIALVQQNRP